MGQKPAREQGCQSLKVEAPLLTRGFLPVKDHTLIQNLL